MTDDLVQRLLGAQEHHNEFGTGLAKLWGEAAARIAELERLIAEAAALEPIVGLEDQYYACFWCEGEGDYCFDRATHDPGCLWLRLQESNRQSVVSNPTIPAPVGLEGHTDPKEAPSFHEVHYPPHVFVHPGAGKDCGLCHPPEVRNVPQDDPFNPPPATTENQA